jgi:hypothetical protein
LGELSRYRYSSVLGDVSRDNTLSVILNTRAGFLHVSISSIDASHLEITVSGLQEFIGVLDLLLLVLLFLLADLALLHLTFRRKGILMNSTLRGSCATSSAFLFFFLDFIDFLIIVTLVEALVSNIVVGGCVSHHAID